jgi:hypothetical protein
MHRLSWASMLHTVRAPLSVAVLLGFALLLPPQTADMLVALTDSANPLKGPALSFHLALLLLAFSVWFWARTALAARFALDDTTAARANIRAGLLAQNLELEPGVLEWTPRILFIAVVFISAGAAWRNGAWVHMLYVAIWGLIGGLSIWYRQRIRDWWRPPVVDAAPDAPQGLRSTPNFIAWVGQVPQRFYQMLRSSPFGCRFALAWLILGVGFFVADGILTLIPENWSVPDDLRRLSAVFASLLPGPGVAIICMALSVPAFTVLTFVVDGLRLEFRFRNVPWRLRRPPILLLFWVTVFITPVWFSLHTVRLAPDRTSPSNPANRKELSALFSDWVGACAPNEKAPMRPIIVAVSGGASRAALWAARVLTKVEAAAQEAARTARTGENAPAIFAVSSVSGGSLGAAAYFSLRAGQDKRSGCYLRGSPDQPNDIDVISGALSRLGHDALGPALAGMLMGDVPRALFGPIFDIFSRPPRGGDRAEAIEHGFELLWLDAWEESLRERDPRTDPKWAPRPFSDAFLDIWSDVAAMPIWIANGTDAQNGARVLTVPFRPGSGGWPFLGAHDALGLLGADVRISTAINNTARFPILEPAGELEPTEPPRSFVDPRRDEKPTQLIDGGYFDNEGIQSARELAKALVDYGKERNWDVRPTIIEATADADRSISPDQVVRCTGGKAFDPEHSDGSERPVQMLAPLIGLNSVRSAHTEVALREVRQLYCPGAPRQQAFFHFYLHAAPDVDVPLNWVLSDRMSRYIWNEAFDACGNAQEYERLKTILSDAAPPENIALCSK